MSSAGRRATPAATAPAAVPLLDLGRGWPEIRELALARLDELARSGELTLGSELEEFEREWAAFCGSEHCVGVADGTCALQLALLAVGAGPGTEVITAANTFIATVEAIALTGARPVLVDANPSTRCLDADAVAAAIGPQTRAVVAVHLYGYPAPVAEIMRACEGRGVAVIEDAAQAHGARLGDRQVGALGTAAAFSFYPTKNLGAFGDAGAVVSDNPELIDYVRSLRHHGCALDDANLHLHAGMTGRLDNLQAALLRLKLPGLRQAHEARRAAAARYRAALSDLPLRLPPEDPVDGEQAYHLFVIEAEHRDDLLAALREHKIGAAIHYPRPAHLEPAWRELGHGPGTLPVAEELCDHVLSLPFFPQITEAEQDRVVEVLRQAL